MKNPTASICTIGDEILIGQIVDTNSSAISKALGSIGIKVNRMVSIGDKHSEIIDTLTNELNHNDIVIVTGGLGPTKDDITKAALAELSHSSTYVENEAQKAIIHSILHSRGLDTMDVNLSQALVPEHCEVLPNKLGTAPIMVFRIENSSGHKASLYSMPGVPFETLGALNDVMEDIRVHHELGRIYHRTLMTFGFAESALSELIASWENALPKDIHLAYLPNTLTGVRLRLSVYGGVAGEDEARVEAEIAKLREILGEAIYSEQDDTQERALGRLLSENKLSLSVAESCTGGEISHLITTVPGSSNYYLGSVTSYAIFVKEKVLGVPHEIIERHGVVSSQTAIAMAEGVRKLTGSDWSVATTGFADGNGDCREPGGTVWVAVSSVNGSQSRRYEYHSDRKRNIERFAGSALYFLLNEVKKSLKD